MRKLSDEATPALPVSLECGTTTGGVHSNRTQQVSQLMGAASVEVAVSAVGHVGDMSKGSLGNGIVTFLKQEGGNPSQAELPRELSQLVDTLFHTVPDKNQGVNPLSPGLAQCMGQDPGDLGLTSGTEHSGHTLEKVVRIGVPGACVEFAEASVIAELDIQAAESGCLLEHLALYMAGMVPGGLSTGGRIHGEQESPPATGRLDSRCCSDFAQEGIHL